MSVFQSKISIYLYAWVFHSKDKDFHSSVCMSTLKSPESLTNITKWENSEANTFYNTVTITSIQFQIVFMNIAACYFLLCGWGSWMCYW